MIENIFYDFDKASLRAESKAALDSMVTILKDNPQIVIEMASHTDRWGSNEYNLKLMLYVLSWVWISLSFSNIWIGWAEPYRAI